MRDLMTEDVLTIRPDASLKEAARRMVESGISGLPVLDDEGLLVGIITESDFVKAEGDRRVGWHRAGMLRFLDRQHDIPSQERKVSDVMTTRVITVNPGADHAEAARIMQRVGVKRLPVTHGDHLVGLVSRSDVMRAFTRSDDEIVAEIKDYVLAKVLWIDPERVRVESEDGNVTLGGRLETRSDAELLVELTKRLDGVASVVDGLSYEVDNLKSDMTGVPPARPRPNW